MMKKSCAIAGVLLAGVLMLAAPALASASTISPNPITVAGSDTTKTVTVNYSGLPSGKRIYLTQCFAPTSDPHFDPFASCSTYSELTVNPSDNTTGSGTVQMPVFHGAEPSGDDLWGCWGAGETPTAGDTAYTTCYIRITDDSETNTTDQQSVAFTFDVSGTTPPPDVPESGVAIALPLLGVAAAGATLFAMRRRRTRAAV